MMFSFHHLTADGGRAVQSQILGLIRVQLPSYQKMGAPRTSVRCLLSEFSIEKETLDEDSVFMGEFWYSNTLYSSVRDHVLKQIANGLSICDE